MYSITVVEEISVAHKLPGVKVCERLHGHNLKVEVSVETEKLNKQHMVVDFRVIKNAVRELDHQFLNDFLPMPTAESVAAYLYKYIKSQTGATVKYVKVWESDKSYAQYWEDPEEVF